MLGRMELLSFSSPASPVCVAALFREDGSQSESYWQPRSVVFLAGECWTPLDVLFLEVLVLMLIPRNAATLSRLHYTTQMTGVRSDETRRGTLSKLSRSDVKRLNISG